MELHSLNSLHAPATDATTRAARLGGVSEQALLSRTQMQLPPVSCKLFLLLLTRLPLLRRCRSGFPGSPPATRYCLC